jgi:chaperone BCS1
MTPAEVAEHLMPKTITGDAKVCLESLIGALEKAKEDAILKAEEEAKEKEESARLKAEEEAKEKEKEKAKAEEEAKEKEKEKAKAEEEAKEKDSSAAENAKKQVKENGFCDNGNGELNNKEKKEEGFSH